LASELFRAEARPFGVAVEVESFGLLDLDSSPALPEAVKLGAGLGVDLSSHRSRVIRPGALEHADLVVGFERAHVVTAVVDAGARREVTFTLPELVTLLGEVARPTKPDSLAAAHEAIAAASSTRAAGHGFGEVPELADPLGRPWRTQEELATRLSELTRTLVRRLFAV